MTKSHMSRSLYVDIVRLKFLMVQCIRSFCPFIPDHYSETYIHVTNKELRAKEVLRCKFCFRGISFYFYINEYFVSDGKFCGMMKSWQSSCKGANQIEITLFLS